MQRKKTPSNRSLRAPHALELFTGRQEELTRLAHFFNVPGTQPSHSIRPILNLYGVGGIGKTTLLNKIKAELSTKKSTVKLVHIDIDDQRWSSVNTDIGGFFLLMRNELHRCGVPTPLFDAAYAFYSQQQSPGAGGLRRNLIAELCSNAGDIGTAAAAASQGLSVFGEVFGVLQYAATSAADAFKIPALLSGIYYKICDQYSLKRVTQLHLDFSRLTLKEMEDNFPDVLHHDIGEFLRRNASSRLAIAIDGFERVQTQNAADDIQYAFQRLCKCLLLHEDPLVSRGCVFFVSGREKLRWNEIYDAWCNEYLDCCRLDGLNEQDAESFLIKVSMFYEKAGDGKTAKRILENKPIALRATRDEDGLHHPYFLDLAVKIICDRGDMFVEDDLGRTTAELQIRFFRHLNTLEHRNEFQALKALALTSGFDDSIYNHLVETGFVLFGKDRLGLLTRDRSYIIPDRNCAGFWRFYCFMQEALVEHILRDSAERKIGEKVVAAVLAFHLKHAHFDKAADCTVLHLDHYRRGMQVAFYYLGVDLLPFKSFIDFFYALNKGFDVRFAAQVRFPYYEQLVRVCEQTVGPEDPDTLIAINHLANGLANQGKNDAAELYYRRVIKSGESVLGLTAKDTLRFINNLANLLTRSKRTKDRKEAIYLHARVLSARLKALGIIAPATLRSLHNLGNALRKDRNYKGAKLLYLRVLEAMERVSEKDAKDAIDILQTRNNLASIYSIEDDYISAEKLYQSVMELRERDLGDEHPDTFASWHNLAKLLYRYKDRNEGNLQEAERLFRKAFEARERVLGAVHEDTITSLIYLTRLLRGTSRFAEAISLLSRVDMHSVPEARIMSKNIVSTIKELGNVDNKFDVTNAIEPIKGALKIADKNIIKAVENLVAKLQVNGDFKSAEQLSISLQEARTHYQARILDVA